MLNTVVIYLLCMIVGYPMTWVGIAMYLLLDAAEIGSRLRSVFLIIFFVGLFTLLYGSVALSLFILKSY